MSDDFLFVKAGDILLTRSHTLSGKINAAYQRTRRSRMSDRGAGFVPTHAALALGGKSIIHSNKHVVQQGGESAARLGALFQLLVEACRAGPASARRHPARKVFGYGVSVDPLTDLVKGLGSEDILLLRHPDLNNFDPKIFSRLLRESLYHIDMPYNFWLELSEGKGSAVFCSQLVYQVFAAAGINVPKDLPNRVLPIDLLNWAHRDNWIIVQGDKVISSLEQDGHSPDQNRRMIQASVESHRQAVEQLRQLEILNETIQNFNQTAAAFVSSREPVRFSADAWMQSKAAPVPISIEGLLIATKKIEASLDLKSIEPDAPPSATGTPSSESSGDPPRMSKPISWLLNNLPGDTKAGAMAPDAQALMAVRLLDLANYILGELDDAAQEALAILKSDPTDESPESLSESPKFRFAQSNALARFLFVAEFIQRSETPNEIEAQISEIMQHRQAIQDGWQDAVGKMCHYNIDDAIERKHYRDATAGLLARTRLLRLNAIACDFANVAQSLKAYDRNSSLSETIKILVNSDYPLLVECFEIIGNIPKLRFKMKEVEDRLRAN